MNDQFEPGFGAQIRAAREALGMSVADVSAKLKLSPRQVEAIELEDLEHLPPGVFLRGFVRNYARLLGLDADVLLVPVAVEETVVEAVSPKNEGVRFVTRGVRRWVLLPGIVLVIFVLLVAALYEWLRHGEAPVLTPPESIVVVPQVLPSALAPVPSAASEVVPVASAQPGVEAVAPMTPPVSSVAAVAPLPVASVAPVVKPVAPPVAPASSGAHSLRFESSQSAWVSVVDAKGQRFSKLVTPGGVEVFKGEPPFRLVVGEAAQVRLSYDGHSIDLTPYIGQKVARLTLE